MLVSLGTRYEMMVSTFRLHFLLWRRVVLLFWQTPLSSTIRLGLFEWFYCKSFPFEKLIPFLKRFCILELISNSFFHHEGLLAYQMKQELVRCEPCPGWWIIRYLLTAFFYRLTLRTVQEYAFSGLSFLIFFQPREFLQFWFFLLTTFHDRPGSYSGQIDFLPSCSTIHASASWRCRWIFSILKIRLKTLLMGMTSNSLPFVIQFSPKEEVWCCLVMPRWRAKGRCF